MEHLIVNRKLMIIIGIVIFFGLVVAMPMSATISLWMKRISLEHQHAAVVQQVNIAEDFSPYIELNQSSEPVAGILATLGKVCEENGVVIKQIYSSKNSVNNNVLVRTQQVVLQGQTVSILKCLREVQRKSAVVKIASVKFETLQQNKINILLAQIYFQNVSASDL